MRRMGWTILAGVVLVTALWTGAWALAQHWLGGALDIAVTDLKTQRAVTVDCPDRRITGWPFQLVVTCPALDLDLPDGGRIATTNAVGKANLADLTELDFHLKAPIHFTAGDGRRLDIAYSDLDVRVGFTQVRVDRLRLQASALSVVGPLPAGAQARLAAGRSELLIAAPPERPDDVDIAAAIDGVTLAIGDTALAPLPMRLTLAASLANADAALAGPSGLAVWQAAGGKLTLHRLETDLGGAVLTLTGEAALSETGLVQASGTVVGRNFSALPAAAIASGKPLSPELTGLVMAFLFMGTAADDGGSSIGLRVDDGVVSANGRHIGRLPPLF